MALNRRTFLAVGGLAVTGPGAAQPSASGAALYFPAGCRLGIRKPADLEPLAGDARNLLSSDYTFQVLFWETLALGGAEDSDVWNDRPHRVVLQSEQTVSPGEQRRLYELSDFAGNADHSWFTFVVRTNDTLGRPDWFGRLFLITKLMTHSTGARARWRATIDAIVASVTLRPALSVTEMLAEHRIAMDLTGLHPHHFGNKLIVGLAPPRTAGERRTNDCYIAMEEPPTPLSWDKEPTPEEAAAAVAAYKAGFRSFGRGPYTEWTSNGIDWIAESERPLGGTDTHLRAAQGVGRRSVIKLQSYCSRSNRAEIGTALERIARSVVLLP